jgi:hypothetical protein
MAVEVDRGLLRKPMPIERIESCRGTRGPLREQRAKEGTEGARGT